MRWERFKIDVTLSDDICHRYMYFPEYRCSYCENSIDMNGGYKRICPCCGKKATRTEQYNKDLMRADTPKLWLGDEVCGG